MPAKVEYLIDQEAIEAVLRGRNGPVALRLARIGQIGENTAKRLVPVDTGRLRSSISWRLGQTATGLFVEIGTNVEYAAFVEFGTRYMSAQPYLVPAVRAAIARG